MSQAEKIIIRVSSLSRNKQSQFHNLIWWQKYSLVWFTFPCFDRPCGICLKKAWIRFLSGNPSCRESEYRDWKWCISNFCSWAGRPRHGTRAGGTRRDKGARGCSHVPPWFRQYQRNIFALKSTWISRVFNSWRLSIFIVFQNFSQIS